MGGKQLTAHPTCPRPPARPAGRVQAFGDWNVPGGWLLGAWQQAWNRYSYGLYSVGWGLAAGLEPTADTRRVLYKSRGKGINNRGLS